MFYDLRVITWRDCLHLDAQGHFDEAATRRFLRDAIWACVQTRIGRVLLDVRDATANLAPPQLASIAMVAAEVEPPPGTHRIAILTRPEVQFSNAQLVAATARGEGWNIAAFHEFEEALNWLAGLGSEPWTRPSPGSKADPQAAPSSDHGPARFP